MIFKYNKKTETCDVEFSWKEIFTLITKRKIFLDKEGLRKLSSSLISMVSNWHWRELQENNKKDKIIVPK